MWMLVKSGGFSIKTYGHQIYCCSFHMSSSSAHIAVHTICTWLSAPPPEIIRRSDVCVGNGPTAVVQEFGKIGTNSYGR